MTRIEQIEAELKAATPGPWRIDGNGDIIQTNHITRDVWYIPHKQADAIFITNAPAHIEAMLPVVKAALAEYDANERYLAIHDECTEEKGQDDDWLEDWMRRDGEALEVWIEVGKAKDAAVRAFKEPRP